MQTEPTGMEALALAVEILGSQSAVARAIGKTQQTVNDVVRTGKRVPAEWCLPLERATAEKGPDKMVSRHQLRPDLYPTEDDERDAAAEDRAPPSADHGEVPARKALA